MHKLGFILYLLLPLLVAGQRDTVYYFGANGVLTGFEKARVRKEIDYRRNKKIIVKTIKLEEDKEKLLYSEKIKVVNDSVYEIKMKGDDFSGQIVRRFERNEKGGYQFTDWLDERIKRTGITKKKIPLIFDGEVTEFYPYGRIKSISQYKNNELISNQNWLPGGEETVDNIFYSVDSEPRFEPGVANLNQQILERIKESKFDLATIEGRIVVAFVILKNGKIGGVRIVNGIANTIDKIVVQAVESVEGKWIPAQINRENVNYMQLFPINFIYKKHDFDYLELKGSVLYWQIN